VDDEHETDIEIAAAIVHGAPGEVEGALGRAGRAIDEDRRRMALAFSNAMAGERGRALAIAAEIGVAARIPAGEARFLSLAMEGSEPRAIEASWSPEGPLELAMGMKLTESQGRRALELSRWQVAADCFSDLLEWELGAPWAASRVALATWTGSLDIAQSNHRWHPRGAWPSEDIEVREGDTLTHIRARYVAAHPDRQLCVGQIERTNRLRKGAYLQVDQKLRIPSEPAHALVDLSSRWVLYFLGGEVADAWECCIGRPGEDTITGVFAVGEKNKEPVWWKEGQQPIPYGDPRNPLGSRWIGWYASDRETSYGFHGTIDPRSIGQAASDGCIRLRNEDIEVLFDILPVGATVEVRP
jgi:hypothetical protein